MILINYLLIGILIVFGMEFWFNPNQDQESKFIDEGEDFKFDLFTRVLNIVIWPVILLIFLRRFIEYLKKIL